MAFDFSQFDATQVDTSDDFSPIPADWYAFMIKDAGIKPTKDGNGTILTYKAEVIDGEYKGRLVFDNLNIQNPNQTAEKIAIKQLAKLCLAVNLPRLTTPEQLNGKIFRGKTIIKKDAQYGDKNQLQDFKPFDGAQPQQSYSAPVQQVPQQSPSAPPFGSGAKKPPFMK